MKSPPVTISLTNGASTPAKRILFRVALVVALVGIMATSTILILHGGFALSRLRYFVDIGLYPLRLTSGLILLLGLLSLITFIILTLGLAKMNQIFVIIAAVLVGICSVALIVTSIWSFLTITRSQLPESIKRVLVNELDQTQYSFSADNNLIVENTPKMARLEKQHACCGLLHPIDEYQARIPPIFASLSPSSSRGSANNRGKMSSTQRSTATFGTVVQLPISCLNEMYRSKDGLLTDILANNTNPLNLYNTEGCYKVIVQHKYDRIQKQGFTTVVAACLAVISCIALAAVVRLLGEGYQIVALRADV